MNASEAMEIREREDLKDSLSLSDFQFDEFERLRSDFKPTLWQVNQLLDDHIVGEYFNRLSTFSVFILAGIPTYISGDSGAGKTQLMDANSKTVLPGEFLIMDQFSDKAIFDPSKVRQIKNAKWVAFPELNKINKNPHVIEVMKSWGEGKSATYERSIMGRSTQKLELPCTPFIFSRATESAEVAPVPTEVATRVAEFMVDSSKIQTKSVMGRIAEDLESPWDMKHMDYLEQALIRWYVSKLPEFEYFINPAASCLIDYVPAIFAASRRDFKKYLRNINGITRVHHHDRIVTDLNGRQAIVVTPADVFYNHIIFGNTLIRSSMRCNEIEKHMIKIAEELHGATKQEFQKELRHCNINTTINNIETHAKALADIGYLMVEREGRELIYMVTDFYREFELKPDFKNIVNYIRDIVSTNHHYASFADEYIERFCDPDTILITNPFTGEVINIYDYEFEEINDVTIAIDRSSIEPKKRQVGIEGWG